MPKIQKTPYGRNLAVYKKDYGRYRTVLSDTGHPDIRSEFRKIWFRTEGLIPGERQPLLYKEYILYNRRKVVLWMAKPSCHFLAAAAFQVLVIKKASRKEHP